MIKNRELEIEELRFLENRYLGKNEDISQPYPKHSNPTPFMLSFVCTKASKVLIYARKQLSIHNEDSMQA